jgi:hypothetical protein
VSVDLVQSRAQVNRQVIVAVDGVNRPPDAGKRLSEVVPESQQCGRVRPTRSRWRVL